MSSSVSDSSASLPASSASDSSYIHLLNPHIQELSVDHYYHLGLDSSRDLKKEFGDTRFVLLCGSPVRAKEIAVRLTHALQVDIPVGLDIAPIGKTERYSLFKVGPVISVSHGMGKPSVSILLHEITKLLGASGVIDPIYIRIGTSGGLGIEPGTVVISTGTVNGLLESYFPVVILGKVVKRPTCIDLALANAIYECKPTHIKSVLGVTMGTDDFYEGQGRLDGAICEHTLQEKMQFLQKAYNLGVRNIEMESDCVVAFCTKLRIKVAVVCTVILNRLLGDQVTSTPKQLSEYQEYAIDLVLEYVKKILGIGQNGNIHQNETENKTESSAMQEEENEANEDSMHANTILTGPSAATPTAKKGRTNTASHNKTDGNNPAANTDNSDEEHSSKRRRH